MVSVVHTPARYSLLLVGVACSVLIVRSFCFVAVQSSSAGRPATFWAASSRQRRVSDIPTIECSGESDQRDISAVNRRWPESTRARDSKRMVRSPVHLCAGGGRRSREHLESKAVQCASAIAPRYKRVSQRAVIGSHLGGSWCYATSFCCRDLTTRTSCLQEERLRRVRSGEKGTPDLPPSIERHEKASTTPTSSEPPPSLLSQSFFLKKLQKSVETVVNAMQQQLDAMSTEDARVEEDVVTCNNSISTQSAFSFSQLEADDQGDDKVTPSYNL